MAFCWRICSGRNAPFGLWHARSSWASGLAWASAPCSISFTSSSFPAAIPIRHRPGPFAPAAGLDDRRRAASRGRAWSPFSLPATNPFSASPWRSQPSSFVISLLSTANYLLRRRQGDWDAWMMYNRAARFLYAIRRHWLDSFSPRMDPIFHADYPLLLAGNIAGGLGHPGPRIRQSFPCCRAPCSRSPAWDSSRPRYPRSSPSGRPAWSHDPLGPARVRQRGRSPDGRCPHGLLHPCHGGFAGICSSRKAARSARRSRASRPVSAPGPRMRAPSWSWARAWLSSTSHPALAWRLLRPFAAGLALPLAILVVFPCLHCAAG